MQGFPLKKWWACQIVNLDPRVPDGSKLLFSRLMEYHNSTTERCFPSQRRLASDLTVDVRTIRNRFKPLKKLGYVASEKGGGRNGSNAYRIWLPSGKLEFKDAEKAMHEMRRRVSAKPYKKPS